jgi:hypothetical protein
MAGLRSGRRPVVTSLAAAVSLVVGSWLVLSSVTAAPASSARAVAGGARGPDPFDTLGAPGPASTSPPSTVEQSTGPLATIAGPGSAPAPPTATSAPTSVPTTASTTTTAAPAPPSTAAPLPAPVAFARPKHHRRLRAQPNKLGKGTANQSSAEEDHVALELIAALNQQSHGAGRVPATADNVSLLAVWMANEGGLWADNPLNTSLDAGQYPHQFSSGGGDTGIPIFPSMAAGVAATATTLLSNPAYARIVKLLRSGSAGCLPFAKAVISSPWASSHYEDNTARFCSGTPPPPTYRGRHHNR